MAASVPSPRLKSFMNILERLAGPCPSMQGTRVVLTRSFEQQLAALHTPLDKEDALETITALIGSPAGERPPDQPLSSALTGYKCVPGEWGIFLLYRERMEGEVRVLTFHAVGSPEEIFTSNIISGSCRVSGWCGGEQWQTG